VLVPHVGVAEALVDLCGLEAECVPRASQIAAARVRLFDAIRRHTVSGFILPVRSCPMSLFFLQKRQSSADGDEETATFSIVFGFHRREKSL
jgi:hypothetical protein